MEIRVFRKVIIFIFLIAQSFFLFAKDNMVPLIKSPSPIKGTTWNKDGTTFAYVEGSTIIVRNSEEYTPRQTLVTQSGIIEFMQFTQNTSGEGLDQLATLTDQHILDIRILPYEEPINTVLLAESQSPSALAYSFNGNYIATGTQEGYIYLFFQNYMTITMTARTIGQLEGTVITLCFSQDNKLLLAADDKDNLKIWNVVTGAEILENTYFSYSSIPVLLSPDGQFIVAATGPKTIGIYNLSYELLSQIETKSDITSVDFSENGQELIILTESNEFTFYDFDTKQEKGYIPQYNANPISSYSFNNTTTKLLVGHTDGSIYVLNIEDVILAPGEVPPTYFMIAADDPEALKKLLGITDDDTIVVEQAKEETVNIVRHREQDCWEFGVELMGGPKLSDGEKPYPVTLAPDVWYKNYTLIPPFYFGGGATPYFGFPAKEFPNQYENSTGKLPNPLLMGLRLQVPFGIYVFPFSNSFPFYAELGMGLDMCSLWNKRLGKQGLMTNPAFSFCSFLKVGVEYKNVKLSVKTSFDSKFQFSLGFQVAYSLNLSKIDEKDISVVEEN